MNALIRFLACAVAFVAVVRAAEYPAPTEGDYVIRDFKFTSGETLSELKIHYRTIGKAVKDQKGTIRNAVLITHGTTGTGAQFIRAESRLAPDGDRRDPERSGMEGRRLFGAAAKSPHRGANALAHEQ